MSHPIRCSCGSLKGQLDRPEAATRCVCYCRSCQAFARFLQRDAEILDDLGGTEVIQTTPGYVSFTEGAENLACMRLTENGLIRWYARCCNTPIGNTLPNFKIPFIGLVHTCLHTEGKPLDAAFGPIRAHVNTGHIKAGHTLEANGVATVMFRFIKTVIRARLSGSYKRTPFFVAATGAPTVTPKILTADELKQVRRIA